MLVPATLYKRELERAFAEYFYKEDMFFLTGDLDNWAPNIPDQSDYCVFQYAIVSNEKLIGYMEYMVNRYVSKAYNFVIFSFDRENPNPLVGRDVFRELEKLVYMLHRVEWRMVGGNHVEKSYDNFCFRHGGKKHILKDAVRDWKGNYHDDVIYEIVAEGHE